MHMLKLILLFGIGTSLAGCLGGARSEIQEFVLTPLAASPDVAAPPPASKLARAPSVGVGPISLPAYLRRPQIVTREGDHRIRASGTHRWGEGLGAGFARVLALNLKQLVPSDRVAAFPWPARGRPDYVVSVEVDRFERVDDGSVLLEARWILRDHANATLRVTPVSLREHVDGDDFSAIVAAMSESLGSLSRSVAAAIQQHAAS